MKHLEQPDPRILSILRTGPMLWICGAILLTFAFTLSGCVSRPALKVQTFAFSAPMSPSGNNPSNGPVLEIRTLQVAPPFDSRSLIYRTGESAYQPDPYAEFLDPPAEELPGAAGEMLRRDGGFSNVVQPGSAVRADIVAEISVTQLYGDNREPGSPYAVLAIRFTFMNATNGLPEKVLFQRSYLRRIGIDSATPAALMAGWNQAMVTILAEVTDDLRAANKPYRASIQ